MKIAVIGAGAVGGYFGGRLAADGNDVVFVVRGKTLEALRARQLRVDSIDGNFEVKVQATDKPAEVDAIDVVLVAVKAWQVPEAAAAIQRMPARDSIIIPLQNGMEAPADLAAVLGPGRVAGGLCRIVAKAIAPGHVDHFGAAPSIAFGELEPLPNRGRLEKLRDAFAAAGVRCDVPRDIARAMWEKFLFITPWGSLGAVTRLPVGPLRSAAESRARLVAALSEVVAIGRAEGTDLGDEIVAKTVAILDGLPADTTSSMQRDIMAGQPSELEAQTGAVVRFGRKNRVPTPVHDSIYAELLPLEQRARGLG
ncbi:MAG: 2-dehydropantoate 2-reductase [Verrucomicrobiota bacterium]|jgi:2-dehydropantoate 2-reductase